MEFKKIKNSELNEIIKTLAAEERKLTKNIIEHIAEVDRRKLFLDLAYPSLFEYLTREIGYSAGAAQRRIDAARLTQQIPEISAKIEAGTLNLNHISKFQKMCRHVKSDTGHRVSVATQRQVLSQIESKTSPETDLILAQAFGVKIQNVEKLVMQKDESVKIELTFTKDEMAVIRAAQQILSHSTGGKLKETFLKLAENIVAKSNPTATVAVKKVASYSKTISPRLRSEILNRDRSCQFKDTKSGRVCGGKLFLEVDHIQPQFAGGSNSPSNLRALCKSHNIFRYQAGR